MDDNSIDLICTSPPYNVSKRKKNWHSFKFQDYDGYGDSLNDNEYTEFMINILNECHRVLKPSGSLMFNHKVRTLDKVAIHPLSIIFQTNLILKQEIIWNYNDTHIHNPDRFYPINEMIYWCIKEPKQTYFNSEYGCYTTVWDIRRANKKKEGCIHPAPFTMEIPKRCIEALTKENDIVLDPFMGSGTTAVVAKKLNRNYIGFDISQNYIDIANKRLEELNAN